MGCCDETTARVPDRSVSRRSLFKGAALVASVVPTARPSRAATQGKQIKLAYCSQLLCGVPYEVARSAGYFKDHGLDVQLVYTRGGNAAPKTAGRIRSITDLAGRTVGISALGNADHALMLYLLKQGGVDARKVEFATMGVNLLEALRQGQMDVGVVQEPALTLLRRSGARVLVNAMDLEDAKHYLGGSFEFMGVAVRAKEIEQRRPEMVALTRALADALKALRGMTGDQLTAALPKEMTTGLDLKEFGDIIARHRDSLYPETVNIDLDAAKRVEQSLVAGGLIKSGASMSGLHDVSIVGG